MKKGISYWSFPGGLEGKKKIRDCLLEAKEAGFDGVELALSAEGELSLQSSKSDVEKIKVSADNLGIEISSLASVLFWDYPLTSRNNETISYARSILKKMIETASGLEVHTILVVPGYVDVPFNPDAEVVPYEEAYERAKKEIGGFVRFAEEHEVVIGIENVWNKFLLSPLELRGFIDGFGSEYVASYFDVGNVMLTGYPEDWIRILGHRIKGAHVKDFKRSVGNINGFVGLLEGDVDWKKVIHALNEVRYDGYVVAEIIPPYTHHPEATIRTTSIALDYILGRAGIG
jgi:hexulose-6-phosphate isomerase